MIPQTTLKDYRDRINILQVLKELNYTFDKSAGRARPHYERKDGGNVTDSLYVSHPEDNSRAGFFRRHPGPNQRETGTVITLIMEHVREFPEYIHARNEIDAVNKICARLSNTPVEENIFEQYAGRSSDGTLRQFKLDDYDRIQGDVQKAMRFFKERGISQETAQLFSSSYELVRDTTNSKVAWHNLGFPYRRPGETDICGYEIRGFGKFKSKAEGSDSSLGCWQAYVGSLAPDGKIPANDIMEIHLAESAYDIMSFVQLNRHKLDLDHSLFISVGGAFSNNLVLNLTKTYPLAKPCLHFDNDLTGVLYDIRVAAVMTGKTLRTSSGDGMVNFNYGEKAFSLPADDLSYSRFVHASGLQARQRPNISIDKPPAKFKDWNEILQSSMSAEKPERKWYPQQQPKGTLSNPATPPEEQENRRGWHR